MNDMFPSGRLMKRTTRPLIAVSCAVAAGAAIVHVGWAPLWAQTSPNAHWEPYKARKGKPSVDQKLTDRGLWQRDARHAGGWRGPHGGPLHG
jgi:hypothetical protein